MTRLAPAVVDAIRGALEEAARDSVEGPAATARRVAAELERSGWDVQPAHGVKVPGSPS
ncbi:hypothetical protein OG814_11710 [Streptomyces zaomyceticus]|uniref:Peptidase M20 n=1 Tax=Streptomyces zaomyceticus TaxID=68286 RepID=A0ABZ1LA02_9ACTN